MCIIPAGLDVVDEFPRQTTILDGQRHSFIGDNRGWLYTSTTNGTELDPSRQVWTTDINLHPESEVR